MKYKIGDKVRDRNSNKRGIVVDTDNYAVYIKYIDYDLYTLENMLVPLNEVVNFSQSPNAYSQVKDERDLLQEKLNIAGAEIEKLRAQNNATYNYQLGYELQQTERKLATAEELVKLYKKEYTDNSDSKLKLIIARGCLKRVNTGSSEHWIIKEVTDVLKQIE